MLVNTKATDMFDVLVVMSQRNQPKDKGEKDVQDCIYRTSSEARTCRRLC